MQINVKCIRTNYHILGYTLITQQTSYLDYDMVAADGIPISNRWSPK